ncbi:hypothetical protein [Ktedonobacter racemifer]|uniref:Uncharacterized protein n=1 Tax=Ktedonobacter racemifer DSM 44963 TaxID=485913 RepID=D6TP50_KTERA|nr:hypothetical protein [Ktedonobacter racemifer]EFH87406.1 hypothetical protein Krac_8737 [Ktedonobacter racemifer DSM 44963]
MFKIQQLGRYAPYRLRNVALGLLMVGVVLVLITPVYAATRTMIQTRVQQALPLNAHIYLATDALRPVFQERIDAQVPSTVASTLKGITDGMPGDTHDWAAKMAKVLIQPSATLTGLSPQAGGMVTSMRISLYPGDPKPIDANLLVRFTVLNATTIQVSAFPLQGSPTLVSGPLTTLPTPLGQLQNIHTTPGCGANALDVGMQLPINLDAPATTQNAAFTRGQSSRTTLASWQEPASATAGTHAYVEIPASSLSTLGPGLGVLSLGNDLFARNIQLSVSGNQLVATSDITLGKSLKLAQATTTIMPLAQQGKLAIQVQKTTVTIFSIFTFPYDTYNSQIQQELNSKLGSALGGKFTLNTASIGPNSNVPCAAGDSMILSVTAPGSLF